MSQIVKKDEVCQFSRPMGQCAFKRNSTVQQHSTTLLAKTISSTVCELKSATMIARTIPLRNSKLVSCLIPCRIVAFVFLFSRIFSFISQTLLEQQNTKIRLPKQATEIPKIIKQKSTTMFATNTGRAVRYLVRPAANRAVLNKTRRPLASLAFSTKIDRAVGGVMNKEFPGYFDKEHHKTHASAAPLLDVHDHRKDYQGDDKFNHLTCAKVVQVLEQHSAVHDCVVIDINVEQHGEIPVAFVVKKPNTDRSIDDGELHAQLVDSLRKALGPDHEALEKDIIKKLDSVLNDKKISDDLIEDELVNFVRKEVGPFAILKVVIVDELPKTTSGKILRGTLYKIARGEPYTVTPMIKDREVLARLEKEIHGLLGLQYSS